MERNNIPNHYIPLGTVLKNKYKIVDYLGAGGFGITYKAENILLGMPVAIKEFYPNGYVGRYASVDLTVEPTDHRKNDIYKKWKEKFLAEARMLAKFSNVPGIVSVFDFFEDNDTAYIVMEYLDGQTLKSYVAQYGKFDSQKLCDKMIPLLRSLEKVHRSGLIHRDISPDNIMVMSDGSFKLFDFGAARNFDDNEEKSMSVLLKRGYTPEEQYRSHGHQGPFTDVYSICGVMYFCLTGIPPKESIDRDNDDDLEPISDYCVVPQSIENAIKKGLSIRSEGRFQSVSELVDVFESEQTSKASYYSEDTATQSSAYKDMSGQNNTGTLDSFDHSNKESEKNETKTEFIWENSTGTSSPDPNKTVYIFDNENTSSFEEPIYCSESELVDERINTKPKKKRNFKLPIIISASAALVAIGIGALVWILSSSRNNIEVSDISSDETTNSTTESPNDDVVWVEGMDYTIAALGAEGKYWGQCKNDKPYNRGVFKYSLSSTDGFTTDCEYSGEWLDGNFSGKGIFTQKDSDGTKLIFSGTFERNYLYGKGERETFYANGDKSTYIGEFDCSFYHGNGEYTYTYAAGGEYKSEVIIGVWTDHVLSGSIKQTITYSNGDIKVYEGEYSNGNWNGKGKVTYTYANGKVETWEGEFENGELIEQQPKNITIKGKEIPINTTNLDLSKMDLTNRDLADLCYLTGLNQLNLSENKEITDISVLKSLKKLTHLNIDKTGVSDISVLKNMEHLYVLQAEYCNISDISALTGQTEITWVIMSGNPLMDIYPLKNHQKLVGVKFEYCPIKDLSPLSGLKSLKDIWMKGVKVHDVSPLVSCPKLENIDIQSSLFRVDDIEGFTGLKIHGTIYLTDNGLTENDRDWILEILSEDSVVKTIYY